MFEVASLATDFFDPRTRTRTDEHGKPLGPPIGARRSPAHSQEQARELADSASRAPRVAMAAGVACLLVGAIIWWRRKAAG